MLIGTHNHNVDAKGRVFIPAKFRDDLGDSFIVTKGVGKCLFVLSIEEFTEFTQKHKDRPLTNTKVQNFLRGLYANAEECTPDKQGRILLPQHLRKHINLEKEAVILGVMSRAEIWSKSDYDAYCDENDEEREDILAELATEGI